MDHAEFRKAAMAAAGVPTAAIGHCGIDRRAWLLVRAGANLPVLTYRIKKFPISSSVWFAVSHSKSAPLFKGKQPLYTRCIIESKSSKMEVRYGQPGYITLSYKEVNRTLSGTTNSKAHYRNQHPGSEDIRYPRGSRSMFRGSSLQTQNMGLRTSK